MYFWIGISIFLFLWGIIRDKSKAAEIGILLFVFVAMAFNRDTYDYNNYVTHYFEFVNGYNLRSEPLFTLAFILGAKVIPTYDVFKIVLTACQLILLYFAIRKTTKSVAFVLALYLIFPAYLDGFHTRFFMGSCLVMVALLRYMRDYSENRNYWKSSILYCCVVVIAVMFHVSLAVLIVVPIVPLLKRKTSLNYLKVFAYIAILLICVLVFRYSGLMFRILSVFLPGGNLSKYTEYQEIGLTSEQFRILVLYFFRQMIRIGFAYFLLYTYQTYKNWQKENSGTDGEFAERFLGFLVTLNCVALFVVVFQTFSVNFERLYRVINMMNYVGAAVCINTFRPHSVSRWKIKLLSLGYALLLAVDYYCKSEFYIDGYRLAFTNNILFQALFNG